MEPRNYKMLYSEGNGLYIYFYLLLSVKKKPVFIDSITDTTDGGSVSEKMIMCETHSCQLSTDGAGDCRRHGD